MVWLLCGALAAKTPFSHLQLLPRERDKKSTHFKARMMLLNDASEGGWPGVFWLCVCVCVLCVCQVKPNKLFRNAPPPPNASLIVIFWRMPYGRKTFRDVLKIYKSLIFLSKISLVSTYNLLTSLVLEIFQQP